MSQSVADPKVVSSPSALYLVGILETGERYAIPMWKGRITSETFKHPHFLYNNESNISLLNEAAKGENYWKEEYLVCEIDQKDDLISLGCTTLDQWVPFVDSTVDNLWRTCNMHVHLQPPGTYKPGALLRFPRVFDDPEFDGFIARIDRSANDDVKREERYAKWDVLQHMSDVVQAIRAMEKQ